jgi:hypothetical protein
MKQLSWQELSSILLEYEEKSNYDMLKTFAAKYYPTATRVEVTSISEYDDTQYYLTYDESSVSFYENEKELGLPRKEEEVVRLIASSSTLEADLEAEPATDLLEWLREQYNDDFCDLRLYGPERGDDLLIDLISPSPEPTPVYTFTKGETHALPPHA